MAKRILVIDDEELITKSLLKLLDKEGYNVTVARSGIEALDNIKKIDFDLIISDVRMPQMDGIETVEKIRTHLKSSEKKPIPEILITGYADIEKYEKARKLEVKDYIYKPFDTDDFLKIVKRNLQ